MNTASVSRAACHTCVGAGLVEEAPHFSAQLMAHAPMPCLHPNLSQLPESLSALFPSCLSSCSQSSSAPCVLSLLAQSLTPSPLSYYTLPQSCMDDKESGQVMSAVDCYFMCQV